VVEAFGYGTGLYTASLEHGLSTGILDLVCGEVAETGNLCGLGAIEDGCVVGSGETWWLTSMGSKPTVYLGRGTKKARYDLNVSGCKLQA